MAKKQPTTGVRLKHFESEGAALDFILSELIATLGDDLNRMEGEDRDYYTTEDRRTMKKKIADIEAIEPYVTLTDQHFGA